MARAKDIAALAGLAGLAYAMRNKDKSEQENKGRQSDDAGYKSTETRAAPEASTADEGTKSNVLKAITAKREAPNDQAPTQGVIDDSKPAPVKPKRAATNTTASKYPSGVMAGSRPAPSTTSSSEEGMKNYKPRRIPTAPPVTKSETPAPPKPTTKPKNILEEAKEEARRRAASQATPTSTSSSTSPTTRYSFPGSSALNKKNGGAVKKMASGGMTASRRADGIASRGKTKCKMY